VRRAEVGVRVVLAQQRASPFHSLPALRMLLSRQTSKFVSSILLWWCVFSCFVLADEGLLSLCRAAGSRAGRVLSKKTVNEQAIAKLCHSVLFPQAELALRLRAVLLQGIVVIYSRQTLYLMKDCKDALKSFHDALHKPQSAQINLSDAVGTLKDLTRPALLPSSDVDFFVDASDMMLVEAQNEAARGQQNENPDLELVLADPYSQLSIRRDDITLREDESMSGFVVGDPAAGQGEELLGGFDFPFDGNVELEHDHNQQQQQLADAPLLPSADEVERNELLDQVNFDDSNSTPAQHVRRKRERAMPADSKTRIEASVLRNWLQADRATAIARPELAVVSVHSGPSANPRSLNLTGICSELQGFFAEISDVPADAEESSEFKRGRMSSVEQGRADEEDGGIVAMDMGWDDALMAGNQVDYVKFFVCVSEERAESWSGGGFRQSIGRTSSERVPKKTRKIVHFF
jgi:hypothetical protein